MSRITDADRAGTVPLYHDISAAIGPDYAHAIRHFLLAAAVGPRSGAPTVWVRDPVQVDYRGRQVSDLYEVPVTWYEAWKRKEDI